jgi:hypothetical protein
VTVDQDPLPEPSFQWRRWVTIGYVSITLVILAGIIWKLSEGGPLRDVALALIASQAFFALLYMGGASASDIARIVASWKRQP